MKIVVHVEPELFEKINKAAGTEQTTSSWARTALILALLQSGQATREFVIKLGIIR